MKNKACHYSLIVAQFRDRYIQVKDNAIVNPVSLKGGYMQDNLTVNIRDNFWEVVQ